MDKVREKYDSLAQDYDFRWRDYLIETKKAAVEKLSIEEGDTVLDLGCGTGLLTKVAAKKVGEEGKVIGLDLSEEMLKKAKQKLDDFDNVELKQGDAHNLPFRNYVFDHVINASMFHYIDNPRKVLQEINRVMKKDSSFLFLDWCSDFFWMFLRKLMHANHIKRIYSTNDVKKLFSEFFEVKDIKAEKISPLWGVMIAESVKR